VKEFGSNSKLSGQITLAASKYQVRPSARRAELLSLVYGLQMIIGSSQDRLEKIQDLSQKHQLFNLISLFHMESTSCQRKEA
jgi:hypothetical protein